jgi:hypothetical protein
MSPTSADQVNLADLLSPAFAKEAFRVDRSKPFTFVCGGNEPDALRHQFLRLVTTPPLQIVPVLAERTFAHQLLERNLQRFEEFLASAAQCVLIFVESPGSFAETGLFAALNTVVKKTLVINTREDARKNSFLNHGPIKLIRKESDFDDNLDLADKVVTQADATRIVDFILATCPKYEKALVFHPKAKFTDLELRLQLGCVHLAVTLMSAGSAELVTSVLQAHFRAADANVVERLLSLLTGIDLLARSDELYFNDRSRDLKDDALIRSVDFPFEDVRARALEWHDRNNSQVTTFLREQRGIDI